MEQELLLLILAWLKTANQSGKESSGCQQNKFLELWTPYTTFSMTARPFGETLQQQCGNVDSLHGSDVARCMGHIETKG
jgi:hypothetical protein